jgi:cytochrome c oxidase subunit 2
LSPVKRNVAFLGAAVAASVLALGACGGDDDDDGGGSASATTTGGASGGAAVVEVEAQDIAFDEDAYSAPAGEVTFHYLDGGSLPHTLLIEGVDDFKLGVNGAADDSEGTVELEAGDYTIYCDIPGHRATMEATLTVE